MGQTKDKVFTVATTKPPKHSAFSSQRPFSASASCNPRDSSTRHFDDRDSQGQIMGQLMRRKGSCGSYVPAHPGDFDDGASSAAGSPNNSRQQVPSGSSIRPHGSSHAHMLLEATKGGRSYDASFHAQQRRSAAKLKAKKEQFIYTRKGGGVVVRQTIDQHSQDPFLVQHKADQAARRERRRKRPAERDRAWWQIANPVTGAYTIG